MVRRGGRSTQGALTLRPTPKKPAPPMNEPPKESANPTENSEANAVDETVTKIAELTLDTPLIPFNRKRRVPSKPFPFMLLPAEVRVKVYAHYFNEEQPEDVIDLGPDNYKRYHRRLGIMRVSRTIHEEATHVFYGTRTFRIFPTHPGKYFKTKRPLLARLKTIQRQSIRSLQLRLGPGWSAPPRGWLVNDALGLAECVSLRQLKVFVECDPSDGIFKGFRRSEGWYETFSRRLMTEIVKAVPDITTIEFDGWSSVKKKGAMMQGLLEEAESLGRTVTWGPEHEWTDVDTSDDEVVVNEQNPFMQGPLMPPAPLPGNYNVEVFA